MSTLLPFHKAIVEKIHDPSTSELLVIARGLGLRRVVCKLLQIYDSAQNLVVLVGASPEEAAAIGEKLGVLGCRKPGLRLVDQFRFSGAIPVAASSTQVKPERVRATSGRTQ